MLADRVGSAALVRLQPANPAFERAPVAEMLNFEQVPRRVYVSYAAWLPIRCPSFIALQIDCFALVRLESA
jgi:hypothetical protein